MAIIETRVVSVTLEIEMTLGERQILWVLTTLQYLAEVGPKAHLQGIFPTACSPLCDLCSRQRSCLCLMLYWDMPLQLDQEAHQLRWTYHVLIYPHYPPVWVLIGICLDMKLNLAIMSLPWKE